MSDEVESKPEADGTAPSAESAGNGESVEARLAAVAVERDEMKDRMLRIAAEFENWKKRARKEQEDGEGKARESVLRDMLDVIDNLERAVSAYGQAPTPDKKADKKPDKSAGPTAVDGPAILKGVGLVLRLAQSKLDRYGVKPIVAYGQPFDPRIHEAISRVETSDHPAGSVAVELQRGYLIGERLLRPAMVSVASAPAASQGGSEGGKGGDKGGGHGSGPGVEDDGA